MSKCGSLRSPLSQRYARLSERLKSFEKAPENLQKLLPDIAEAGFYYTGIFYTGERDAVRCFHCPLTLNEWGATEDPWIEHAYWNPHCAHVLCNKGCKWVRQAFNAHGRAAGTDIDYPLDKEGNPQCTQKCHICLERDLRIAFLPCGHLCACAMCAAGLQHCPICRHWVEDTVRIFMC